MKNEIFKQAKQYHSLGLNVVPISPKRSLFTINDTNILKSPNCDTKDLLHNRQNYKSLKGLKWKGAVGLGLVLGYENLCAIDIDGCLNFRTVTTICKILGLDETYQWVFKSGSHNGYHIVIQCNNKEAINFTPLNFDAVSTQGLMPNEMVDPFCSVDTNAYYPSSYRRLFHKLEFKWKGNLVVPNSIHMSGLRYEFNNKMPQHFPASVEFERILAVKLKYCDIQAKSSDLGSALDDDEDFHRLYKHYVAKGDEFQNVYFHRQFQSHILFDLLTLKVDRIDNLTTNDITFNQLSWYVIDNNFNVIKRKIYNYLNLNHTLSNYDGTISYEEIKNILVDKRYAILEFLFDLEHNKEFVVSRNDFTVSKLKHEIIECGFYLDNFGYPSDRKVAKEIKFLNKDRSQSKDIHNLYLNFLWENVPSTISNEYSSISDTDLVKLLVKSRSTLINHGNDNND